MARLELQRVSRHFDGVQAVDSFTMIALPGRITGVIGPNGAGKTTLVNLISGLLKLSAGRILLDGRDIGTLQPDAVARLGVARTFQNVRLLKEASVIDNIVVGCQMHDRTSLAAQALGLPSVRRSRAAWIERASTLLSEFQMTQYAELLAGELSYGHQRRVEIMRALATEPRVLLLDEPVAGMNDVEAHALGEMFRQLADRGLTILLIEHNMQLVMALCDELYVLDSGKLIAAGEPAQVQNHPAVIEAYLGAEVC
jgi:branched-chain amino acid transport system ATP-binding protein